MDSLNSSSKSSLLQEDNLSSIRRRNRTLILVFFSLIISLAIIIACIIVSLVHNHNLEYEESIRSNPAIKAFCAVTRSQFNCISTLSNSLKITPNTDPNQIFALSLDSAASKLSDVVSGLDSEANEALSDWRNCSSSLNHALSQLRIILRLTRVDPDVETLIYERRTDFNSWIQTAVGDLRSCVSDLRKVESIAIEERAKVYDAQMLVEYSGDFLPYCDFVNANFRFDLVRDRLRSGRVIEDLLATTLFGSQYVVLLILFCLLFRVY